MSLPAPLLSSWFGCNISNTRDSVSPRYPNTYKRAENTTSSRVFWTNFQVFRELMKHYLKWLMYLLSKQKQGVNGDEVKLSESMLIRPCVKPHSQL